MGITKKKKQLIAFKTWLWERHDISVPNKLINEYLGLGVPKMRNPPPPPGAAANDETSENSLHKQSVIARFLVISKALFFFKPYTKFPRWFEIACGVIAWWNVAYIILAILRMSNVL